MPTSTCANPLLLEWIKEIYDLARERNTKGVTTRVGRFSIGKRKLIVTDTNELMSP